MTGVAALAICAAFTSCSKSDELYDQGTVDQMSKEKVTETYNARFLAYVGGTIAPDQDWGFGSATRAVHKKDPSQGFDYENEPAAVTQAEADFVYAWFQDEKNKGLTEVGRDWDTFYLQHVYGTMDKQKKGLWNKYDQNYMNNHPGATSNWEGDVEFSDKGGMDYLILTDNNGYVEHVNDFNAESGGPYGIVYMTNSSALYFGYHSSWDNSDRQLFKLAQITVPGECFGVGEADRTGWYVGLSLYGEKEDNSHDGVKNKRLGEQRLDWGDDWILKVVPGETTTPPTRNYTIRVLGEDLTFANSASNVAVTEADKGADFDFNDVVFDVAHVTGGTADENGTWIRLMAAGGTLPLYIGSVAEENEVHKMFNVSQTTMVNTGKNAHKAKDPVEFKYSNSQVNAKDIPIIVIKDNITFQLSAQRGEPASKIAVSNMNFDWADERQSIKERYPSFIKWAQEGQTVISEWWN